MLKREDLACHECHEKEASHLLYWSKYYPDAGKVAYLDPSIICEDCKVRFTGSMVLYERRPVIMPFEKLGRLKASAIGFLLSSKGKETNMMNNKFWRKKIWRIKCIYSQKGGCHE